MTSVELSGLIAALCWTVSNLLAPRLIAEFGAFRFNTIRIAMASITLLLITLIVQSFSPVLWQYSGWLILSGLIGIFIGDTCLFSAFARLGPRRTGVLFATNAPMAIVLAWFVFDETLSPIELFACGLVTLGAVIAILYGKRKNTQANSKAAQLETTHGNVYFGIGLALIAAFCQVAGALLSKPALLQGADPIAVSAIRVSSAACALLCAYGYHVWRQQRKAISTSAPNMLKPLKNITFSSYCGVFAMAFLGMVVGMSVLVWGIGHGNVGIVTTLSATVPVLILPALWLTTGQRPAIGAWLGAILVVTGAALIALF
ncbi:DMT family transporter [Marinomonas agarivorans]|nr:DMT family transporter [Marinomonas agarivorans]